MECGDGSVGMPAKSVDATHALNVTAFKLQRLTWPFVVRYPRSARRKGLAEIVRALPNLIEQVGQVIAVGSHVDSIC